MNDYVVKPIDTAQFVATLARWIKPRFPAPLDLASLCAAQLPEVDLAPYAGLTLFDVQAGLRRTQNNVKLYRRLLQKFHDSNQDFRAQYLAALADPDTTAAERLAHTLKGLAATLEISSVSVPAYVLEMASPAETPAAERDAALDRVELALVPALAETAAYFAGRGAHEANPSAALVSAQSQPITISPAVVARLSQLAAMLQEGEGDSADVLDDILSENADIHEVLRDVQQHVSRYDFFGAYDALGKVVRTWGFEL
jgi:HPt (histidine-containing phosphotransfer) domain-containing protein